MTEQDQSKPRTKVIMLDEAKIQEYAKKDFWGFDAMPCDLEGDDLGVHERLTVEVTYDTGGQVTGWKVTDCDRKGER